MAGAALAGLAVWGVAAGPWSANAAPAEPTAPVAQDGSIGVLHVQPFRLAEAYKHLWRAEAPRITAGYLVVLDVASEDFVPRQSAEPVLQFGAETVERINRGDLDGRLIGIVPMAAGEDGWPVSSLEGSAPFLAAPALPEQISAAAAADAWNAVVATGFAPSAPLPASAAGLDLGSKDDLMRAAAALIQQHAPSEGQLAESLAMPLLRRK